MERSAKNCLTLLGQTFMLSAFTFGGGYVIILLMKRKFADELGWIEEEEALNIAAIAQSSPGPIAVNAAILLGWRLMGLPGALLAILGTVTPPLIILSVIAAFYGAVKDNALFAAVMKGMTAGVCAVIIDVTISLVRNLVNGGKHTKGKERLKSKERWIAPVLIMAAAFAASFVFQIGSVYIITACGVLGALMLRGGGKGKGRPA